MQLNIISLSSMNRTPRRNKHQTEQVPSQCSNRDSDPFIIVHHHRKAKKLKKLREIRRKKILIRKQRERLRVQSEKKSALEQINRSMLLQQQDWNNVKSLIVSQESKVSLDQQLVLDNKIKNLCWQVLYIIPAIQKSLLYRNQFCKFEYGC